MEQVLIKCPDCGYEVEELSQAFGGDSMCVECAEECMS